MVNKKEVAKQVIQHTPIGVKLRLLKWIFIVLCISFFLFPVILLFVFSPEKEEEQTDGDVVCEGGHVKDKGISVFNKNAKGGALDGKGKTIVKIAEKHKIPPNLFVAIIASESEWGKGMNATKQKNPLSIMGNGPLKVYNSVEDGLNAGAKNLYDLYIKEGLTTPDKIGPKYAPVGASNDPSNMNKRWIPTVTSIMKELSDKDSAVCKSKGGKDIKFDGKIPKWSDSDPGKNNLYTAGQCTWYAYGIRQKMGKLISTYWFHAQYWNDRAKEEGYKVNTKPAVGALMIAEPGPGPAVTGHVAVVIGVKDDKTFTVTEMNIKGPYIVSQREMKVEPGISFIHDKE
ncbi:TPA: CHAP domain-containing protein [Staphylococcus aureus]|uniref:CHAP domain-containing protein n=1 Tax=Staphylococcus aureus TaxID=1280 RepID=UPI002292BBE1|nr:CHAP domain-containing protein [Staphylococcus aureus]MDI1782068.1 CHAP domain-containing protein [Staphylococcus aureus]MEC6718984.1 CHAP domain-containing protein [Staphylococcus aureus]HCU7140884.1 CHAP domain-containing protein [Staphylococcus aureus]HCU7142264.1 CHAP domain-containing protein [Staphylococcus aureus]HDA0285624.1 CHAP domain-containing protein [Staphylococcus aureus]